MGPCSTMLLNALKALGRINDDILLLSPTVIEPIQHLKVDHLGNENPRLHTDEVLVALSMLSRTDDNCRRALDALPLFEGCQVHCTVMLSEVDRKVFKKLGVGLTCDPIKK